MLLHRARYSLNRRRIECVPRCLVNVCLFITRVSERYSGGAIVCCVTQHTQPALHAATASAAARDFQAFTNNNNFLNFTTLNLYVPCAPLLRA